MEGEVVGAVVWWFAATAVGVVFVEEEGLVRVDGLVATQLVGVEIVEEWFVDGGEVVVGQF